jgi:septum formation protein
VKLVLASQSPRRLQILRMVGFDPEVRVSGIPELRSVAETPEDYVSRLALQKAEAVMLQPGEVVLAADTTVVLRQASGVAVFEKPSSAAEAAEMLRQLSGRGHEVYTGFALRSANFLTQRVVRTVVEFYPLSEEELLAYVATGEPLDKAGAYAIQGSAARFVSSIQGCFFNVVGLPIGEVCRCLAAPPFGLRPGNLSVLS